MLVLTNLLESLPVFQALSSDMRLRIIQLLAKKNKLSISELAHKLGVTNGAMTNHINKLVNAGIIKIEQPEKAHGNSKVCTLELDRITIVINELRENQQTYESEIKVGHYSSFHVTPSCGLATPSHVIGQLDDPRYFSHPERFDAGILWFRTGFVEYMIPNLLPPNSIVEDLTLTMELSSEAPTFNNFWPSDIRFYVNDTFLGIWTSPGDFGDKRGTLSPKWWSNTLNQYGLLKTLTINKSGSFIDGERIGDISIDLLNISYDSNISLKLEVRPDSENPGGLTIYGDNFGNHPQNIKVSVSYVPSSIL